MPYPVLQATFDGLFSHWWQPPRILLQSRDGLNQAFLLYAQLRDLRVHMHHYDVFSYGNQAAYASNIDLINDATHIVAFWDGRCPRMAHLVDFAQAKLRPVEIFYLPPEQ